LESERSRDHSAIDDDRNKKEKRKEGKKKKKKIEAHKRRPYRDRLSTADVATAGPLEIRGRGWKDGGREEGDCAAKDEKRA